MEQGGEGEEELCARVELAGNVPRASQGPALHLSGSQIIVCCASCPVGSLTSLAARWGEGCVSLLQQAGWLGSLCILGLLT